VSARLLRQRRYVAVRGWAAWARMWAGDGQRGGVWRRMCFG
jgi:hypothetical protein